MREDPCLLWMRRGDAVRSSVDELPSLFSQMHFVPRVVAAAAAALASPGSLFRIYREAWRICHPHAVADVCFGPSSSII